MKTSTLLPSLFLLGVAMASTGCNGNGEGDDASSDEAAQVARAQGTGFSQRSWQLDSPKGVGRLEVKAVSGDRITFSLEARVPGNTELAASIANGQAVVKKTKDVRYPTTATFGNGPNAIEIDLSRDGKTARVRAPQGRIPGVTGLAHALTSHYVDLESTRYVDDQTHSVLRVRKARTGFVADLSVYNRDTEDAHLVFLGKPVSASGASTVAVGACKVHIDITDGGATIRREGPCDDLPAGADFAGTFTKY
jgi:hypothetical protein